MSRDDALGSSSGALSGAGAGAGADLGSGSGLGSGSDLGSNPGAGAGSLSGSAESIVDWSVLREHARAAMSKAYVPYSRFPVGAAALVNDGRIVSGCNVENASYGVTLCAECSLVSALIMSGGGQLLAFTCVDGNGATLMPCGRCRQLLYEHSAEGMLLETVSGLRMIDQVLPDAFGPRQLTDYREPQ